MGKEGEIRLMPLGVMEFYLSLTAHSRGGADAEEVDYREDRALGSGQKVWEIGGNIISVATIRTIGLWEKIPRPHLPPFIQFDIHSLPSMACICFSLSSVACICFKCQ